MPVTESIAPIVRFDSDAAVVQRGRSVAPSVHSSQTPVRPLDEPEVEKKRAKAGGHGHNLREAAALSSGA